MKDLNNKDCRFCKCAHCKHIKCGEDSCRSCEKRKETSARSLCTTIKGEKK